MKKLLIVLVLLLFPYEILANLNASVCENEIVNVHTRALNFYVRYLVVARIRTIFKSCSTRVFDKRT